MKTIVILLSTLVLLPLSARAVKISYAYDAAGRMTAVNYDGASRTAYGYDKNGSLLSRVSTVTPALTPPPHLAATFNGLITNGAPGAANSGIITLKLLANGAYSGKLAVGGVTAPFKGSFAADGGTAVIAIGKPPLTSLVITLDVLGSVPRITGTLSGTGFNSAIAMDAVLYNSKTLPLPAGLIGKYTAVFLPTENTAGIPQGDGYATVTVKNTGSVTLAGKLADNSKITHSSLIHGVNVWPLFIPLNKNAGFLSGRVIFAPDPGYSDFGGFISWVKPDTPGAFHPDEFATGVDIVGARYRPPLKDQRALNLMNSAPNAVFTASGGGLATDPFTRNVTLDTKNKFLIAADAGALKLTLAPATGVFTGSFKDGAATRAVGGVILQTLNNGSGFFPGATESGLVELAPSP